MQNRANNLKLSPSQLTFLWDGCRRCFYLKVVHDIDQPSIPMPRIFNIIHSRLKEHFDGVDTSELDPSLPPGKIEYSEKYVRSGTIVIPGQNTTCYFNGRFDTVASFEDGTYGVIDFKTAERREDHIPLYSRQLHAYAYCLENPAPGKLQLSPVSRLGLLCVEPTTMMGNVDGTHSYVGQPHWIPCERDDGTFEEFLAEVVYVLSQPDPPEANASCHWCQYRDTARRTKL